MADADDEEGGCIGCLFVIGIMLIIVGAIWAFGPYGMLFAGLITVAVILYPIIRAKHNGSVR